MTKRDERGQATVEFALIIPLVMVVLLAVVQVCFVAYAQLAVSHLAREAARTLAVDPTADLGHLVDETATLGTDHLVIEVLFGESALESRRTVTVSVTYQTQPLFGLFASFSDHLEVHSVVQMIVET